MTKILLVEDDTSLRENVEELLELSGFEVFTASNGKIAVEMARKEHPDLVLCDIMMPEMDGYEVLEHLSSDESTKHIPFIFVSAKTERHEIRKGMNLGADDYLTKPFEEHELLGAIQTRLEKAKQFGDALLGLPGPKKKENDIRSLNELKNFFDDNGQSFSYKKDETIYSIGDHSNMVHLILGGVVKCCGLDEEGKELITSIHCEDDFLGFTSLTENLPHQDYAVAMEDVELAGISKERVKAILEDNKSVSLELMDVIADNLANIKRQLLQMAYSSVRKKTAQTLLMYSNTMNRGKEAPLKVTRSDLAGVAGIATESLIRTLSDFRSEGLIAIENRNIKVLDKKALEHVH
ncbi:DNA-binding response regulator, OmpR family, contains REC and winged-helix (wHTH) domain [Flagellimonas taeanensis]|jgi:DNA-binding response OmpR family regulator|uniref:Crp-like helix-turn-helix domain-containing protein n=1 Tax=Flagellimonas taeanensis TaxID=1005926 RepID=A0A1M6UPG2_9FLAO|nr:response regulator [Allomuricauda taeanensis]SFC54254.1 DNA-binding response regulator, OmpR family, contains REC and winged-helix (wHTH) domain [Allomuricauda taeanensis]SHK71043.1 Crp-like helix-turn-helix domain-containing protein [Allomuricauda taeanensis]